MDSIPYFESSLNDLLGSALTGSTTTNSSVFNEPRKNHMENSLKDKIDEDIVIKVRKEKENEHNQPGPFFLNNYY